MSNLKKNITALFLMQGINYLIPLISLPLLTRNLGVYNYGMLGTATAVIQYAILFIDFGFNLSSTKAISQCNGDKNKISIIFWNTLLTKLLLLLVSIFVLAITLYYVDSYKEIKWIVLSMSLQLIGSVIFPIWLFQGLEKIQSISIITSLTKLISLPLLYFFVTGPTDVILAAFIQASTLLLAGIIGITYVYKKKLVIKFKITNFNIKKTLLNALPLFLGSVAISIYTLSTPIILSLTSTYEEVGYYSAADKLRNALLGVFLIFGQALFPRITSLFSKDVKEAFTFIKKIVYIQLVLSIIAAILFYLYIPLVGPYILSMPADKMGRLLQIMSPMIIFIPLSVIMANYILVPNGHTIFYAVIPCITAIAHMPYAWFLSTNYGAIGASYSILITETISFIFLFFTVYKLSYVNKIFKTNRESL